MGLLGPRYPSEHTFEGHDDGNGFERVRYGDDLARSESLKDQPHVPWEESWTYYCVAFRQEVHGLAEGAPYYHGGSYYDDTNAASTGLWGLDGPTADSWQGLLLLGLKRDHFDGLRYVDSVGLPQFQDLLLAYAAWEHDYWAHSHELDLV